MIARRTRKVDDRIAASLQMNQGNNPPAHSLNNRHTMTGISTCFLLSYVSLYAVFLPCCANAQPWFQNPF